MKLPATFTKDRKAVHAIIETPRGSRCKYTYEPDSGLFLLKKVLPGGTMFPMDFGFIPRTEGGDGDPLDVLLIMEKCTYPGCLVPCRMIGVIEAEQQEKDRKKMRNDRLIAVPVASHDYAGLHHISEIPGDRIENLVHFFEYYNRMEGKVFTVLDMKGPDKAMQIVKKGRI